MKRVASKPAACVLMALLCLISKGLATQVTYDFEFDDANWEDDWGLVTIGDREFGQANRTRLDAPAGTSYDGILRVDYPAGSANPGYADETDGDPPLGGTQFLTLLPGLPPGGADAMTLEYDVRFGVDFPWSGPLPLLKTGKLPGLYGGCQNDPNCVISGGSIPDGTNGISTRYSWREDGQGELRPYIPNPAGSFPPRYGDDNPAFAFNVDQWYNIRQEVVLNTVTGGTAQNDGIFRVWLDDVLVVEETDIIMRTTEDLALEGIFFSTFFGGSGADWATPIDTHADFAAFSVTATIPEPTTVSLLGLAALLGLRRKR